MRLNRHFIRSIEGGTPSKATRLFLLPMGESLIAFSMRVEPLPGSHTTPPEAARRPEDGEVLEAIERVFLGSLGEPPKQPDLEKGWDAYRAELLETHGCRVPSWAELPEQVRECFAVGVGAATGEEFSVGSVQFSGRGGEEVPGDQWAVSREERRSGLVGWDPWLQEWSLTGVEGFLRRRAGEAMQTWIERLKVDGYSPVPHVAGSYVMKGPGLVYNREGQLVGRSEYGEQPPVPVPDEDTRLALFLGKQLLDLCRKYQFSPVLRIRFDESQHSSSGHGDVIKFSGFPDIVAACGVERGAA